MYRSFQQDRTWPIVLQGILPRVKIGGRLVGAGKCTASTCWWSSWLGSHITSPLSAQARASKQCQEQTASLQTALLPETYRAGHGMSRTGGPYLKPGEQSHSDAPRATMTRQRNGLTTGNVPVALAFLTMWPSRPSRRLRWPNFARL
jgi:hypothetical protein